MTSLWEFLKPPINTAISVLHCQSHTSFSKQCRYRWEAANKERVKSLRSFKIVFWNYLLVNKLFCSKNKKNSPWSDCIEFLYKSLHATYLVILLSSADSFQNKYFQEISGKKSRCQIVWIQIRTKHTVGPDLTPNCSWMLSADDKSLMISCFQKRDISRFSRTKVNLCKCIYYNIVTLFVSTSIHFYFTLLVGNYLGILSSAVFSKLIYYIVPSLSLSESQTVWIQIRSDILSVLIWF